MMRFRELKRKKPLKAAKIDYILRQKWVSKRNWRQKERRDAKDMDGRRMPRSGGLWYKPGDVRSEEFLFECKNTSKLSYSVSTKTLKKIYIEAIKDRKFPALSVELGDKTEFVVLRKDDFLILTNKQ